MAVRRRNTNNRTGDIPRRVAAVQVVGRIEAVQQHLDGRDPGELLDGGSHHVEGAQTGIGDQHDQVGAQRPRHRESVAVVRDR